MEETIRKIFAPKKGILAADESGGSIKKKFEAAEIEDNADTRREYRSIFLETPDLADFISGVILFEETADQIFGGEGKNAIDYLIAQEVLAGIKLDRGLETFPDSSGESYTLGLDDLNDRANQYANKGATFAKWRAAYKISPSPKALLKNSAILAEYAAICQLHGLVPIVEPELVFDSEFSIEEARDTTTEMLNVLFASLKSRNVDIGKCILKTNMVSACKGSAYASDPETVANETLAVFNATCPKELGGVVFLSGGQTPNQATDNFAEIMKRKEEAGFSLPLTFSFARAFQAPALEAWAGKTENIPTAREAFYARLVANRDAF